MNKSRKLITWRAYPTIAIVLLFLVSYSQQNLIAQSEDLVVLNNISPGIDPSIPHWSYNYQGQIYFGAFEPTTGLELWKTDALSLDTEQVADLLPGSDSSEPRNFTEFQGKLYFTAVQSEGRRVLWQLDSITSTPGISDISNVLSDTQSIGNLFLFHDHLLVSTYGINASEPWGLWQTDGTITGTNRLTPDLICSLFCEILDTATLNNVFYFVDVSRFDMQAGYTLWRTDGTQAGTYEVTYLGGGKYVKVTGPVLADGKLFFARGPYPELGETILSSDGTSEGTTDVAMIAKAGYPEVAVVRDRLLIAPDIGTVWYSDGQAETTAILKEINPQGDANPGNLTSTSDIAFFSADDGTGNKLWRSDGQPEGTILVTNTFSNTPVSNPGALQAVDGQLYFLAETEPNRHTLWRASCDGLSAKPLSTIPFDSIYVGTSTADGLLLGASAQNVGRELWLLKEAANGVLTSPPLVTGTSGQFVTIPIELSNRSSALATGTMTVTAIISDELSYQSDTSGITPTLQANTIAWELPVNLSGCRSKDFELTLQLPLSPIGTTYHAAFKLNLLSNETIIKNNQQNVQIVVAMSTYLPLVAR